MKLSKFRLLPSFAALALFAVVTQWTMTTSLSAQTEEATVESVETAEEAAAAEAAGGDQSLIDMYKNGGWAMYPLTLLSISAFGLIVYNFMAINPNQILQPSVLPEIDTALQALDIEKARSICDENPAPSTNIIHAGLVRVDTNRWLGPCRHQPLQPRTGERSGRRSFGRRTRQSIHLNQLPFRDRITGPHGRTTRNRLRYG